MPLKAGKYRLREGKQHQGVKPGQVVDLSEDQANAFRDKFEPVDGPATPTGPPQPADVPRNTSGKAQDAGSKTPIGETAANTVADSPSEVTDGKPPYTKG